MSKNIKVVKILPQGYCKGVVNAIKLITEVINSSSYTPPLYMLGELVHNSLVTEALKKKGVISITDYHDICCGTIIVTAHGLSDIDKQNIVSKGLQLIDATCPEVNRVHNTIKEKINNGYTIFYYGKENHPECKAVLSISNEIKLISNINNIPIIDYETKIFFTNQTTMSYYDTLDIINALKNKYCNIDINIDICKASKMRQEAVYNKCKDFDLVIIVGDKKSNNTNKLKQICDSLNVKNYFIQDTSDLKNIDFEDNITVGITAGASTPNKLVHEIIKLIEDDTYISSISDEDFITF